MADGVCPVQSLLPSRGATLGNPTPLEIPSGGTSRWKFQRDVELSSDPAGDSQRVEVPLGIPSGT